MTIMRLLFLAGLLAGPLNAGKLISDFNVDQELDEMWNQFLRMQSIGTRNDIKLDIRIRQVAEYIADIKERIKNMKAIKIVDEDRIEKFCKLLPPYENYEENHAAIMHGNRLGLELQPFYTASDMPADDDLPSFSDGDWDDDRDDDFEGQGQESDGSFVLD